MTTTTSSFLFDKADGALSPQLRAKDDNPMRGAHLHAPSTSSLIIALAAELEASESRAQMAERRLADYDRHCICCAGKIADDEMKSAPMPEDRLNALSEALADPAQPTAELDALPLAA